MEEVSKSDFTGGAINYFGMSILCALLGVVGIFTLGILTAYATILMQKWVTKHTVIDGKQLHFEASFLQLWVKTLIWMLLTLVTLGFYAILGFMFVAQQKFFVKHTSFAENAMLN